MLVKCHECSGWIADSAEACPHCGAKVEVIEARNRIVCPLCKLRIAERSYEVELRKQVKRERVLGGEIDHYIKDKVKVQLCSVCHAKIENEEAVKSIIAFLSLVGGFVWGFASCEDWRSALLAGVTFSGLAVVGAWAVLWFIVKGVKRLRNVKEVKNRLDYGWSFDGL